MLAQNVQLPLLLLLLLLKNHGQGLSDPDHDALYSPSLLIKSGCISKLNLSHPHFQSNTSTLNNGGL